MSSRLHMVVGEELLLRERAISTAIAELMSSVGAANHTEGAYAVTEPVVSTVRAAEVTASSLAELTSGSLFAEHRMLIVEDMQQASADSCALLIDLAGAGEETVTLVVCHSGIARNKPFLNAIREQGARVHDCAKITRVAARVDFVRSEFRNLGVRIPPAAAQALVEAVGSDLRELARASSQLASDTGGVVNEDAVHRYFQGKAEVSGFEIADLAVSGDTSGAVSAVRWALTRGVSPVLIADTLGESLLTLARIAALGQASPESVASRLSIPAWRVKKTQAHWRMWTGGLMQRAQAHQRIDDALQVVAELNAEVKGKSAHVDYAIENAVRVVSALVSSRSERT